MGEVGEILWGKYNRHPKGWKYAIPDKIGNFPNMIILTPDEEPWVVKTKSLYGQSEHMAAVRMTGIDAIELLKSIPDGGRRDLSPSSIMKMILDMKRHKTITPETMNEILSSTPVPMDKYPVPVISLGPFAQIGEVRDKGYLTVNERLEKLMRSLVKDDLKLYS